LIGDLAVERPMNRLLQGDVGSGKTVVAAFTLLLASKNNKQAALLVPTEILAEQHFRSIKKLLEPFNISVGLLTAATETPKREKMLAELRQNKLSVLIGTHAMLQEDVTFHSLAIAVIDEQHKFGVHQRSRLLEYALRPHQLVMTATPIPRTLALTIYGDLKISTMKEMPAGRKPIKTYWVDRAKQADLLAHVRQKLVEGEQAFFVFPMIDETEKIDLKAAEKEFKQLKAGVFKDFKMGLVHGRIAREEREWMMREFREGKIHVLVATSVVEVGVDHPNATMMVIENAERFGLAQLHQLRGRIGRGSKASECFLFGEPTTEEGKRRLKIMTKTQDGFLIAEEDLKLRGPGDFMGTRQSGEPYFRVGHPLLDEAILLEARETAHWLKRERRLELPEWALFKSYLEKIAIAY
jgi:ATP-dependent DNA helicase RecG